MKKILAALLVLALVAPAMADVSVTATDLGSQKLQIKLTTSGTPTPVVRGLALWVTVTGGSVANVAAYTTPASAFNTFIDYAAVTAGYTVGMTGQHPFANELVKGIPAFPIPSGTKFSLSMGYLDQASAQAGLSGTDLVVATIQLSGIADNGSASVAIVADTIRAGAVVGDNLGTVTVQASQTVAGPVVVTECVKSTAPFYAAWVSFGKPNCWCYEKNCKGDADGLKQGTSTLGYYYVGSNDLAKLTAGWQVKEAPKGPGILSIAGGICADFARDQQGTSTLGYYRVGSNDLAILTANWQIKEPTKGPGIGNCGTTNYNFFTLP